jgi:protein TonB
MQGLRLVGTPCAEKPWRRAFLDRGTSTFQSLIESAPGGRTRTSIRWTTLASACAQLGALTAALLYSLPQTLQATLEPVALIAPLPLPAPAPGSHLKPVKPLARFRPNELTAPRSIPRKIEADPIEPPPNLVSTGPAWAAFTDAGLLGGVLSGSRSALIPPPPVRVGGDIMEGKRLDDTVPDYPAEAIKKQVMGTVVVDAMISEDGRVTDVRVLSGPPLLIQAALDCISKFRYEPTLLNGVPTDVKTTINIIFRLIPFQPPQKK